MSILHVGSFCYVDFALTGSFVIHMYLRRQRQEIAAVVLTAAGFAVISMLQSVPGPNYIGSFAGRPGAFLGLGSIVVLAVKVTWMSGDNRPSLVKALRWTMVFPLLCIGSAVALVIAAYFTPTTYDLFLHAFDLTLGAPAYVVGRLFREHSVLAGACFVIYNTLPLYVSVFMIVRCTHRNGSRTDFALACATLGVLGFLLYQVCPGTNPRDAVGGFPYSPPAVSVDALAKVPVLPSIPRNATPSLHIGWILLCFWNARGLGISARVISTIYLVLTALATLGTGEHYLIDLVVAVPLCLCVQAICLRGADRFSGLRLGSLVTGGVLTLAWLIALRTGVAAHYTSPAISWTLASATVVLSCLLEACLRPQAAVREARAIPAEFEIVAQ